MAFGAGGFAIYKILKPGHDPVAEAAKNEARQRNAVNISDTFADMKYGVYINAPLLTGLGATSAEIKRIGQFDFIGTNRQKSRFIALFINHRRVKGWLKTPFYDENPGPCLKFPDDVILGSLSLDSAKAIPAVGKITLSGKEEISFYPSWAARAHAEILEKFRPGDLHSLYFAVSRPEEVVEIVQQFTNLKDLFFYNPLLKAVPGCENYDESVLDDSHLPAIDKLQNLDSLGLCGPRLSGTAVLDMQILKRLKHLAIKRISQPDVVIEALPSLDNLEEVTLIDCRISDEKLEPLSNMKNLRRLTVLRSDLSPSSIKYFKQMTSLRTLTIDRNNWSADEKAAFVRELPQCRCLFTPVLDETYWQTEPSATSKKTVPGLIIEEE